MTTGKAVMTRTQWFKFESTEFKSPFSILLEAVMKKFAVLCALLLAATATMATSAGAVATIDAAWGNCAFDNTPVHTSNVTFICDGGGSDGAGGTYKLFATLHAPTGGYPQMAALQAQFDVQDETGPLPAFWAFETGGCNADYLSVNAVKPATCGTTANTPWVPANDAQGFVLDYQRAGNRAHMEVVVTTLPTSAQNLASDADYFLFNLAISEDSFNNAPPGCAGCGDKVAIVFNSIKLESSAPGPSLNADPLVVSQSGSFGNCGSTNGASAGTCAATPTQKKTWGAVKSLYR